MTKAQIAAFEAIAINRPAACSRKTLEQLLARGVYKSEKKSMHSRESLPPSVIADYYVPLPVHYQWSQWAEERYRGKLWDRGHRCRFTKAVPASPDTAEARISGDASTYSLTLSIGLLNALRIKNRDRANNSPSQIARFG